MHEGRKKKESARREEEINAYEKWSTRGAIDEGKDIHVREAEGWEESKLR